MSESKIMQMRDVTENKKNILESHTSTYKHFLIRSYNGKSLMLGDQILTDLNNGKDLINKFNDLTQKDLFLYVQSINIETINDLNNLLRRPLKTKKEVDNSMVALFYMITSNKVSKDHKKEKLLPYIIHTLSVKESIDIKTTIDKYLKELSALYYIAKSSDIGRICITNFNYDLKEKSVFDKKLPSTLETIFNIMKFNKEDLKDIQKRY